MNKLQNIGLNPKLPIFPEGQIVHIVTLREVKSPMVLRTDEVTNVAQTATNLQDRSPMTRISMVKRKQVAAERRTGRMLLRRAGIIAEDLTDGTPGIKCEYNVQPCKRCPDCVIYGAAIGESLSIKSRVLTEDALSIQPYSGNTTSLTFNGATEAGNMNKIDPKKTDVDKGIIEGEMNTALGSQEHVNAGVIFPALVTLRDVTAEGLWYVLGNVMRTSRYGAQATRGGGMHNHVIAIIVSDAEVSSNLELTLELTGAGDNVAELGQKAIASLQKQLQSLPAQSKMYTGQELAEMLDEVIASYQDEAQVMTNLNNLMGQIDTNIRQHVANYAKAESKGKAAKGKTTKKGKAADEETGADEGSVN